MTSLSQPNTHAKPSLHPLALLGVGMSFFAILVGIILPFFAPPLLKLKGFQQLFHSLHFDAAWAKATLSPALKQHPLWFALLRDVLRVLSSPVVLCAILGPSLALFGLYRQRQQTGGAFLRSLQQLFGCQIIIACFAWLVWQGAQLAQTGWLSLRHGPIAFAAQYPALFWGPFLVILGLALFTKPTLKEKLGLTLAATAYHLLIILGLYLFFAMVIAKQFPMRFQVPSKAEIASITNTLGAAIPLFLIVGTVLLGRGNRLNFHLLMTSPLWVPFFVVYFFWSLVVNTTLYFLEDLTGRSFQPPAWVRLTILPWLCLPLFPLLLTLDFGISLMRYFGQAAVDQLFPVSPDADPSETHGPSPALTNALGALLLLTVPLWILPTFFYLGARLFIVESLLQSLQGRAQEPHKQ